MFAVVFFIAPFLLIQAGATHYFEEKLYSRLGPFFGACMGCISYACYFTKVEKRAISELSTNGAGFLSSGRRICASVARTATLGGLRVLSVTPSGLILLPLIMHVTASIVEEMLVRGIFFRMVRESWGNWLVLAASGVLLGAMHLVNDNTTVLAIANNAAAGVLLASAFLRTGRLWLCAASHAAWNFFQDEIFQ